MSCRSRDRIPGSKEEDGKARCANARDEIRKLHEALKEKDEDPGSTDGFMVKKIRAGRKGSQKANGIKPSGKRDEQTTEKVAVQRPTQANTKEMKEEKN